MPLISGKFEDLVLPSEKHARVLFDPGRRDGGGIIPWRFRVLHGGRNGYKDWSAVSASIERGIRKSTRYLLTREVQNTIADSWYQLILDTIKRLGYSDYFIPLANRIKCRVNDTSYIFRGLNDLVSEDVKSTEGIDVAIIGEAQNLTEKSMNDFEPTIRKEGSEIWMIFNDRFETDFVYQFCVKNPPKNMICELVTYLDTDCLEKTTPQVVIDQAERDKKENPKLYDNKWLGKPLTTGLFFSEFGDHNRCLPFIIPENSRLRLIGSLDHGIVHNTSFGLTYIADNLDLYRMFTYCENGGTARFHAEAILEKLESFPISRCQFPHIIFYDYSMDAKHKLNEWEYKSELDEYKEVFRRHLLGKSVQFVPANKRKIDGCNMMRTVFRMENGKPRFFYFFGLNDKFVDSVKGVVTDDVNAEIYAKMDGDDSADECRYGIMGANTICSSLKAAKEYNEHGGSERLTSTSDTIRKMMGGLRISGTKGSLVTSGEKKEWFN